MQRSGGDLGGPGLALDTASLFASGLVQGKFDLERTSTALQVLFLAVDVGDNIIVFDHGRKLDCVD